MEVKTGDNYIRNNTGEIFEVIEVKTVIVLLNRGLKDKDGWSYDDRVEYKLNDFNISWEKEETKLQLYAPNKLKENFNA